MVTMDGAKHEIPDRWDLLIAHPPCTYLTAASAVCLFDKNHTIKDIKRYDKGVAAKELFLTILNADCPRIAVENPAPLKIWGLPKYSQIIEPYHHGDPWKKRTCLWLKGLPLLEPTDIVEPLGCWVGAGGGPTGRTKLRSKMGVRSPKERSKTFTGIARAMAEQWAGQAEEDKMTYQEFLETKIETAPVSGFDVTEEEISPAVNLW